MAPFWRGVVRFLRHDTIFVPIAVAYAVLLLHSWQADTLSLILPGSLAEGLSGYTNASRPRLLLVQLSMFMLI